MGLEPGWVWISGWMSSLIRSVFSGVVDSCDRPERSSLLHHRRSYLQLFSIGFLLPRRPPLSGSSLPGLTALSTDLARNLLGMPSFPCRHIGLGLLETKEMLTGGVKSLRRTDS